jgi:protein tyrosine phosphatase (PTP) superfamily phosphohydrolase (DUF442 family)
MITQSKRIILTETEPVITPRDPKTPHNFGLISNRESTLFTAERPGHPGKNGVLTKIVEDWIQFIKSKGIHNVLILMDDDEFGVYEVDLKEYYEEAGLTVYHIPFSSSDSYHQTMALIRELDAKGEKVVSHCTGGKGRCGRVACAWLCKKWNLSPLEASQEFIDQAVENGLYRLGDVQKLKDWMGYGSCEGTKSHDSSECCFPMDACS